MNRLLRLVTTSLGACALTFASACSNDGDGAVPLGGITVAVTDAASDDLVSFQVEISDVQVRRTNGAFADILEAPVVVDLVSLADLSQVLNVASLPLGTYDGATVTIDMSTAVAAIQGNAGPATILDFSGSPLTGTFSVPLQFSSSGIGAAQGSNRLLVLDFDLDQSLIVNSGANIVSVEPVLFLRGAPASPKPLTALGRVAAIDLGAGTFVVSVATPSGVDLCSLTALSSAMTLYQVDGVANVGGAGLTALDALGVGTWVEVQGTLDPSFPETPTDGAGLTLASAGRLMTTQVLAGTGSFNGGTDIVEGYVTARSSGAGTSADLTVVGSSQDATHATFQFNTNFTVNTSFANTKVVQDGSSATLDLDDVSIGQRVRIFGALSGNTLDATTATDVVRMLPTDVFGSAAGAPVGSTVTITLDQVGPLPETDFTWADSGANPPDPMAFTIDGMGSEAGLGIVASTVVSSSGIFAPIDDAGVDHNALDVAKLEDEDALLIVRDLDSVGHVLTLTPSGPGFQVALSGTIAAGEVAQVDQGFLGTISLPNSPVPQIFPPLGGAGDYALCDLTLNVTTIYSSFAQFTSAVSTALGQGASVRQVAASGVYDSTGNIITASSGSVCIQ